VTVSTAVCTSSQRGPISQFGSNFQRKWPCTGLTRRGGRTLHPFTASKTGSSTLERWRCRHSYRAGPLPNGRKRGDTVDNHIGKELAPACWAAAARPAQSSTTKQQVRRRRRRLKLRTGIPLCGAAYMLRHDQAPPSGFSMRFRSPAHEGPVLSQFWPEPAALASLRHPHVPSTKRTSFCPTSLSARIIAAHLPAPLSRAPKRNGFTAIPAPQSSCASVASTTSPALDLVPAPDLIPTRRQHRGPGYTFQRFSAIQHQTPPPRASSPSWAGPNDVGPMPVPAPVPREIPGLNPGACGQRGKDQPATGPLTRRSTCTGKSCPCASKSAPATSRLAVTSALINRPCASSKRA